MRSRYRGGRPICGPRQTAEERHPLLALIHDVSHMPAPVEAEVLHRCDERRAVDADTAPSGRRERVKTHTGERYAPSARSQAARSDTAGSRRSTASRGNDS